MVKRRRAEAHAEGRRSEAPLVDLPSARLREASGLWRTGQHAEALAVFEEAMRQEPNNVQTYVAAARAYADKFHFNRMEQTHERLVRRAPQHPGVHHYIGETFGILKLPERAIASYERAARLPGAGPPTWMELASLYERAHRLDEAAELIERTVRSGYDVPLVALVRGRIQRRQKRLPEAEATFRGLIARINADSAWACQAWGELALMKDTEGEWDGAIDAIERCKRVQRMHEEPLWTASQTVHARLREMVAAVTQDDFRHWRDECALLTPLRTALLTGFPRSGTTLLEQVLDAHPDLVSSEEREFIGRELFHVIAHPRNMAALLDILNDVRLGEIEPERRRYFEAVEYLLGEPVGGRMHLDKNPAYNLTIPLVLRVFSETRLIIALRDPRDVVLSCYLRYLPLNGVSVHFLDVQRTAERYALDMQAWLKFRELIDVPWCEIRYEDTVADIMKEAKRALATLGLEWHDAMLDYRQRLLSGKHVGSPSYESVAQPLYTKSIGRWKHYERLLAPALETLEPFVKAFGYAH
jgi:tetratricopeptide (TPR) repeat protein